MKTAHILFRDFLFIALLGFMALVVWMLPHLNPPTNDADIETPGTLSVTIAWQEGPIDVDLWVHGPDQTRPVGYSNRGGKTWNLLRDDLGTAGDRMPFNMEHAFTRGLPAGEYIINAHCFGCGEPALVAFEVRKGNASGKQTLLFQGNATLTHKQEKTLVRFKVGANGNIIPGSVSMVRRPLRSINDVGQR